MSVQVGNTLWVANDETISLGRLSLQGKDTEGNYHYREHKQFPLSKYLRLPAPATDNGTFEEADIEGLDYKDGYLWLVRLHSLKRRRLHEKDSEEDKLKNLESEQ